MQILLILYPKHVINYYGIIWGVTLVMECFKLSVNYVVANNNKNVSVYMVDSLINL